MPTYLVETTARPGVTYEVDQSEYDRLLALGLLVGGPAPSGPGVFDTEMAAVVADEQSQTRAAIRAALVTTVPTLEELERTTRLGTVNASTTLRLGPVNLDQRIGGLTLASSTAVAASDTNYWTVSLLRLRAGQSPFTVTTKTSKATGGEAFAADQGWNFDAMDWLETARHLRKGDVLGVAFTKTGTAADLTDVTASVRYEPGLRPPVRDTFSRVDSASSLGVTDTGQAWETPLAGTLGVTSGQGYASALTGGYAYVLFNAGMSDYTLSVRVSTAVGGQGLVFRATDYSNLWDVGPTGVSKTAGGTTTFPIGPPPGGVASGDVLSVRCAGATISFYKNGVHVGSTTDSFNQTATRVGIWASNVNARLDDLALA